MTLFTEYDILERVDEYSLYCHYLNEPDLLIGGCIKTPVIIRDVYELKPDTSGSFAIFTKRVFKMGREPHEFLWTERAIGKTGDIFDLVQLLGGYETRMSAIQRIAADFGLGAVMPIGGKIIHHPVIKMADPAEISVKSRPFSTRDLLFWDRVNVGKKILNAYDTKAIQCYWTTADQKEKPKFPSGLCFSYEIDGRYQLYMPYSRYRFRNNWLDIDVPGFAQLENTDVCVITKSMKDVMCMRSYGYDAVGVRGEWVMLHPACIAYLKRRYRKIYVLFDNDGKHNGDKYEFEKIFIPEEMEGDKDVSDYTDNHGPEQTEKLLKHLIV